VILHVTNFWLTSPFSEGEEVNVLLNHICFASLQEKDRAVIPQVLTRIVQNLVILTHNYITHIRCQGSLMMEAVRTSETSVDNHSTRQYNPEGSSEHHTRRRENLKSHRCRVFYTRKIFKLWKSQ
jgi:hypothetical protein